MPAPGNPQLSALWLGTSGDRALAAERVRAALASSKTRREAARVLGIGHRTLYDWLRNKPELQERKEAVT
jgi:DNA invertase Pin-like site-specific DNA recombinase